MTKHSNNLFQRGAEFGAIMLCAYLLSRQSEKPSCWLPATDFFFFTFLVYLLTRPVYIHFYNRRTMDAMNQSERSTEALCPQKKMPWLRTPICTTTLFKWNVTLIIPAQMAFLVTSFFAPDHRPSTLPRSSRLVHRMLRGKVDSWAFLRALLLCCVPYVIATLGFCGDSCIGLKLIKRLLSFCFNAVWSWAARHEIGPPPVELGENIFSPRVPVLIKWPLASLWYDHSRSCTVFQRNLDIIVGPPSDYKFRACMWCKYLKRRER